VNPAARRGTWLALLPGIMDASKNAVNDTKHDDHAGAGELAAEALVGAAAGAATGTLGGPPGMVIGALLGGAIGAAAGVMLHRERAEHAAEEEQLDRDIGVSGGNIGAAPPDAPRSVRGTFHAASMGVGGGGTQAPSEGSMQTLDED
jgi:Glycine zipper